MCSSTPSPHLFYCWCAALGSLFVFFTYFQHGSFLQFFSPVFYLFCNFFFGCFFSFSFSFFCIKKFVSNLFSVACITICCCNYLVSFCNKFALLLRVYILLCMPMYCFAMYVCMCSYSCNNNITFQINYSKMLLDFQDVSLL